MGRTLHWGNVERRRAALWKQSLGVVLLAGAAVALRWPFLHVPMITDEGGYAYVAHFWSRTYELYRDIPFDRPQGIFLLYECALAFGHGVAAIRLFAAVYNAVTTVAVFCCARSLFGVGAAWLAGCCYALFSAAPHIEGFTANAELFTSLPLVWSAHLAWKRRWLSAGLLAGIATVVKPSGVAGVVLAVLWALLERDRWSAAVRVFVGFAAAPLASMAQGWLVDWHAYWASFIERRLLLYSAVSSGIGAQWYRFCRGIGDTLSAWIVPAVLGALAVIRLRDRATLFVSAWVASSWIGMALGGEWHWHYFQQLIPPLAVLAGSAARGWRSINLRWLWMLAIALACALFMKRDLPFWFRGPHQISWTLYQWPGYLVARQIAQTIDARSAPADRIYVAFAEAEIYYLAERRSAVPQLYMREVEYSQSIFDQVLHALRAGKPKMVVWVQPPPAQRMGLAEFGQLLSEHYTEIERFGPFVLLDRRGASAATVPDR